MPQHALGNLRHVGLGVHLGEYSKRHRVGGVDRQPELRRTARQSRAGSRPRFRPTAAGSRPTLRNRFRASHKARRASAASFAGRAPPRARRGRNGRATPGSAACRRTARANASSAGFHLVHRLHRIGQDQRPEAASQRQIEDLREMRVHERLAAGEADQPGAEPQRRDLVEVLRHVGGAQINQPVIARRGFDIAVAAGQIAQRAGIEPQRVQRFERDLGARFAGRGPQPDRETCPDRGFERRQVA